MSQFRRSYDLIFALGLDLYVECKRTGDFAGADAIKYLLQRADEMVGGNLDFDKTISALEELENGRRGSNGS